MEPSKTQELPQTIRLRSKPIDMYFEGSVQMGTPPILDDVHRQPVVYGRYQFDFQIDEEKDQLTHLAEVSHEFFGDVVDANMEKKIRVDPSHNIVDVWERER